MKIQKVSENELDYICAICLDPSIGQKSRDAMQGGMTERICWIRKMMPKGLEILVALEKPKPKRIHYKWAGKMLHSDLAVYGQVPMGLLEYMPGELALEPVKAETLLVINCMWVLPPFWQSAVGKALLESFFPIAKHVGGACVLAYEGERWFGTTIKYMPSSFFKRFGFKEVARDGNRVLLFLDLGSKLQPELIYPKIRPSDDKKQITIEALVNSQCPWSTFMIDTFKTEITKYPRTILNIVRTDDRKIIEEYGISRGVLIDGKPVIKRMAAWKEIQPEIETAQQNFLK